MRLVRVLIWLAIGVSVVELLLLGFAILWITSGGLLEGLPDYVSLAAVFMQALMLLGVLILTACRAEGRWTWIMFLMIEALSTVISLLLDGMADAAMVLFAILPMICTATMAGLSAAFCRMRKEPGDA